MLLFRTCAGQRRKHRIDGCLDRGLAGCQLGVALRVFARQPRLAPLEMFACGIGVGDVAGLRQRHRFQHDAIDRARGHAQFAAGAVVRDHGMHQLGRTHDGVDRTGLDALGAADAVGLDDACQRARFFDAVLRIQRNDGLIQQRRQLRDAGGATGYLIGEAHKGLRAMFTMMNEARLGVALQGLSIAETAYQNAAIYARERNQGRALSGAKEPEKKADPIIVHPDIRRNLMTIRAFNEAGRALILWTALNSDIAHRSGDEGERQAADDLVGLLTPVLKGVLTDKGFEHAVMAQQVFGGHGYIEEHGMSQYVRDARIAMIYEGANGIQALDLVGRKLALNGGRAVTTFFKEAGEFCEANRDNEKLSFFTKHLKKGLNDLQAATMWLMQNAMAKPDNAGAASNDYMHLFGLVALGLMWGRMAKVAEEKLAAGEGNKAYLEAKLVTARYYFERIMPESATHLARIQSGADSMMALPADAF